MKVAIYRMPTIEIVAHVAKSAYADFALQVAVSTAVVYLMMRSGSTYRKTAKNNLSRIVRDEQVITTLEHRKK